MIASKQASKPSQARVEGRFFILSTSFPSFLSLSQRRRRRSSLDVVVLLYFFFCFPYFFGL